MSSYSEERARKALAEAGRHVYGGRWIDHGADCELGQSYTSACTCGLSAWLTENADLLGISFPVPQPASRDEI